VGKQLESGTHHQIRVWLIRPAFQPYRQITRQLIWQQMDMSETDVKARCLQYFMMFDSIAKDYGFSRSSVLFAYRNQIWAFC
jgi:hypothetical protein